MSEYVKLTADDGHEFEAYVARPIGKPIGGLVVVQEIFGVNQHIRSVADAFAKDRFLVIAPALFDRTERAVELAYDADGRQRAMALMQKLNVATALLDVAAALEYVKKESGSKAAVIGYCYGGKMAWLASTRLQPAAAVGYYAGGIGEFAAETPNAPTMLHFGTQDTHIPKEQVDKVSTAHPEVEIYWYNAGHAFNNDMRESYEPASHDLARERSVAFLRKHLSGE